MTYTDDTLVHSADEDEHKHHLCEVFQRLKTAGLTLHRKKCHIGMSQVTYLGHVFSVKTTVRKFLGLASYYRRYIHHFSEIPALLHALTQKEVPFNWSAECVEAFTALKDHLTQAPGLAYPRFDHNAGTFYLQTDASAVGLGAVLEQNSHPVAYASRTLTCPEKQYTVIQRECLTIVFALKQFRHCLLGGHFKILTDHAPLQ